MNPRRYEYLLIAFFSVKYPPINVANGILARLVLPVLADLRLAMRVLLLLFPKYRACNAVIRRAIKNRRVILLYELVVRFFCCFLRGSRTSSDQASYVNQSSKLFEFFR